jgi:hypothetical protein
MSDRAKQTTETDSIRPLSHYGPCVHCGHLSDEHGERDACLRAGYYGNTYGCCEVEHGQVTPTAQTGDHDA